MKRNEIKLNIYSIFACRALLSGVQGPSSEIKTKMSVIDQRRLWSTKIAWTPLLGSAAALVTDDDGRPCFLEALSTGSAARAVSVMFGEGE